MKEPPSVDLPGVRKWFGNTPLAVKLAVSSAGLAVIVLSLTFFVLRSSAVGDVRRVFTAELGVSQAGWRALQDQRLSLLLNTSNVVSTSPTLRAALETERQEANAGFSARAELIATVRREAERVFADLGYDLLVVTNERGRVLAAVAPPGVPLPTGLLDSLPVVRHALGARVPAADSSFGIMRLGGKPFQVGAAAILLQGFPIGVLLLGEPLDSVVGRLGPALEAGVVVTAGDEILVAPASLKAAGIDGRLFRPAATEPYDVLVGHEEFVAASLPLGLTEDRRPAAAHLLRSLTGSLHPLERTLEQSFLLAGLLAVLGVGGATAMLARAALEPLSRFAGFLRRGAEGHGAEAYRDSRGAVEIRTMIGAHNRLIDTLARERDELAHANDSLRGEITERERAEAALGRSQELLRQAQKLEALGRLAGGVAHDFNNLLMVIAGSAGLIAEDLPPGSVALEEIAQITDAADRAAALCRQLLAFGRQQVLEPRLVDLSEVIRTADPLLRRLAGDRIKLELRLAADLPPVKADPSQLIQVVMNLVVNGRDAMGGAGTVSIETAVVELQKAQADRPGGIPGGPAVMIAVSDTGSGMDAETQARIFEPFFTTKAVGKGTGLGLATVYGIVAQTGGSITVYSTVGRGTTFRIYLPPASVALPSDPAAGLAVLPADAWSQKASPRSG
ncbi:MAG: ATP-binding protein [Gemmatimonadota bacterium]